MKGKMNTAYGILYYSSIARLIDTIIGNQIRGDNANKAIIQLEDLIEIGKIPAISQH